MQHNYGIIILEKNQALEINMKKKIVAGLLTSLFIINNSLPASAFIRLGVQKDKDVRVENIDKNTKTNNIKVEKVKVKKAKKTRWTNLAVKNKYDYINLDWWDGFNDEILNGYIVKAMDRNHSLKSASYAIDEYYQNVKAQMSHELPSINAGALPGVGGTDSHGSFSMIFPVFVSYELDLFLKNHDKTKSVKKLYEASIQDERAAYISVISAVGTTYYNIVQLDKLIELQTNIVSLRQNIFDTMELSNKEGITSTSDVMKANKALVSGQTHLIDLKKQRVHALNQLAVLIGESPMNSESLPRAKYDDIVYQYNAPAEISSEIVTQRPDYIKAEILLQKAGIDVRVAKKEFLPSINLGGLALFSVAGPSKNLSDFIWGLGGGALHSFYSGGAKMANMRLNKVRAQRMLETYKNINLTSIQEINDSMYSYKSSNDKYNNNLRNYNLESKDFALSQKMYEQGVISKLDLNQREENLLTIDSLVVQSKTANIIDSIGLYKATGAGVNKTQRLPY